MKKNVLGQQINYLIPILELYIAEDSRRYFLCVCDCGNQKIIAGNNLYRKDRKVTKTCGCLARKLTLERNVTHGHTVNLGIGKPHTSKIYSTWASMKGRCLNPRNKGYPNYGGRGIKVCDRWLDKENGFQNFLDDMGEAPANLSIDRINNDGNYEPENCRWATRKQQSNNVRTNHIITYNGESKTKTQWAEQYNMPFQRLKCRLDLGWTMEEALTTPTKV